MDNNQIIIALLMIAFTILCWLVSTTLWAWPLTIVSLIIGTQFKQNKGKARIQID